MGAQGMLHGNVSLLHGRRPGIRLVITDCDGVLTDGGVYYSAWGESMKRFSVRDGMGVALLRKAGIEVAVMSGERSASLARRTDKLSIRHVYLGAANKEECLRHLLAETGLQCSQVAYIGDDVNDLPPIAMIAGEGITAAPADAEPAVREAVQYLCVRNGGYGAFREFADWILEGQPTREQLCLVRNISRPTEEVVV